MSNANIINRKDKELFVISTWRKRKIQQQTNKTNQKFN